MPRSKLFATDLAQSELRSADSAESAQEVAYAQEASADETRRLRQEVTRYIAQMSAELASMARASELSLLSYFLDMAAAEAGDTTRRLDETSPPEA